MLSNLMNAGALTLTSLLWQSNRFPKRMQRAHVTIWPTGSMDLFSQGLSTPGDSGRALRIGEFVRISDWYNDRIIEGHEVFEVLRRERHPGWEGQPAYTSYTLHNGIDQLESTEPERLSRAGYNVGLTANKVKKLIDGKVLDIGGGRSAISGTLQLASPEEARLLRVYLDQLLERGAVS